MQSSCLAQVIPCYETASHDLTNACDSKIADCKNACSAILDLCQKDGVNSACQQSYSACLGSNNATAPASSCLAQGEQTYLDNAADNTAAAKTATCKQTCGVLKDACMTSGDNSECQKSYENCLFGQVTTSDVHCVSEVYATIQKGSSDQDAQVVNAQCKDFCARGYDILSGSGDASHNATALSWYSSCLGAKNLPTLASSCVSNSESSYLNATTGDNAQDSDLATCKSQCSYLATTCQASGDESVKAGCLSFYSDCTSGTNSTTSTLNCVADVEQCYLDGKDDRICDDMNAQCKNQCTRARSACGSSGDPSVVANCDSQYESCLGSSKLVPSTVDCVARTEACYTSGKYTDAECDAQNAICKTTCSRSMDTCTSGGNSTSIQTACSTHYSQCLGSYEVSPISTIDCVKDATACFLSGDASNNCSASTAVCKTQCSRANDVCLSSGDASVKPACQKRYENCLGASVEAEEAATNINCIARYTSCHAPGSLIADNECQKLNADCKNTCSQLLDSCGSSSANSSTSAQCQGVYNACLGNLATSLVDYKPLDCAGRMKTCQSGNNTLAECDRQDASCGNSCATTLDTCLTSTTADKAACNHLYMLCQNKNNFQVTSIPASLKPTISSIPSVNATSMATAAMTTGSSSIVLSTGGAVSTGGAFVTGPYNNGSSTADAQTGAQSVATSTESTVYVTDVVKTTITTCPIGQVITSAGSTTTLTAPSVMTTAVTVKSTVTAVKIHTVTIPVGGNNAIPSSKASTSIESTVYVTDVVKATVTTCPIGQVITSAGSTTTLTAPSVMTTSVTVKSTISTTVAHTITAPASGNNVMPTQTSTSLESTVYVTDVVKTTVTTCPIGQVVTSSGSTTTLTAPSVMTSQVTIKSTVSTVLTHTAIVPQSSPVAAEQTTPASVDGHVAVPSTVTLYSTKELTITSCAPEVTDCPARSVSVSTTVFPTAITVSSVWSRISSVPVASSPVGSSAVGSSPAGSSEASPETTSAPVLVASTMYFYSTAVATVTSCAEGVEHCPAQSTVVQTSVVPTAYAVTSVISSAWTPIQYTSPAAGVPEMSAPAVSAPAPVVPTSAPFAVSNSTMMSVGPKGTGVVGTGSGSKATSTYSPSQYTGAANKVGAAGLAGVAAFAAFLL
jgi:hypothetical protein